jgi:hypothetical protein
MTEDHGFRITKKNSVYQTAITFSPAIRQAFADLATTVSINEDFFSERHFHEILSIVEEWGAGRKPTIDEFITAFPSIANESIKYIQQTGDLRAKTAWETIALQMVEDKAFILDEPRIGRR